MDPDYPRLGQSLLLLGLVILAIGLVILVATGLEAGLGVDATFITEGAGSNLFGIGLVVLWACRHTGLPASSVLRFASFPPLLLVPLLLFAVGESILASEADNALRSILPMPEWMLELFLELMNGSLSSFLALVVIAPLTEELLFRGLILRGLIAQLGVPRAIFYSALLFGAFHMNPWQFASAFGAGIVLGWIFVQGRSLLPCVLLHAGLNTVAFAGGTRILEVWGISIPGYSSDPSGPVSFQPPAFDLLGLLLVAASLLWMKRIFERDAKRAVSSPT